MADPRGLFVNPNNRGFGTVLGPGAKDYFDYALLGQQAKQKAAADKAAADQKRKDKFDENVMKMLKPLDTYKIYQDAANSKLNEAIDLYEKGQLEYPDLLRYTADYHNLVTKGKELQSNDENAYKNAVQNKRINEDAWVQMRNETLLKDQTIDGLQRRIQNPDNGMVFYQDEVGGSRALNEQTVVKEAIDVLGQQALEYTVNGNVKWLKGKMIQPREVVAMEHGNAFEEDAATGEYRVKDVAKLRELGIIRSLMNDKDFSRIVMDKIILEDGFSQDDLDSMGVDDKNRLIDAKVAEVLEPYAGGKSSRKDATDSFSYSTKSAQETKSAEDEAKRKEWYQHLKSKDPVLTANALNFLTQDEVTLTGATLQRIRKSSIVGPNTGAYSYRGNERDDGVVDPYKEYRIISIEPNVKSGVAVARIIPLDDKGQPATRIDANDNSIPIRPENITIDLKYGETDPEFWLSLYSEAKGEAKANYNQSMGGGLGDDILGMDNNEDDDVLNMN